MTKRKASSVYLAACILGGLLLAACGSGGGGGPTPPANQAPNAALAATPPNGDAPLNVQYDASGSNDPDGTIATYDWDMDNDGTFEVISGGATPAVVTYNAAGTYTVRVRVTDNGGLSDTATVTVTVTTGGGGTWTTQALDTGGAVGQYCCLAMVGGRPAISYYDGTNGNLKFIRATDATGSVWAIGSAMNVTTGPDDDGYYTSMAMVDGNPAISFYDFNNDDLRFVRAVDAAGTDWSTAPVIVEGVTVSNTTSLSVVAGNPAIAYDSPPGPVVNYERATNATGGDWGDASRKIDGAGETGMYPSLAMVDGMPAVAFQRTTGAVGALYYVRAGDGQGTGPWQAPLELHADGAAIDVGVYPSLAVVDGSPAVSYEYYIAMGNADPYFVRANDAQGGAGNWDDPVPTSLDPAATIDGGGWSSLAMVGGVPQVAFYNYSTGTLWHVRAVNADGSTWLQPEEVDDGNGGANTVGRFASMVDVGGNPGIAYYDSTDNDLKYAVLQ